MTFIEWAGVTKPAAQLGRLLRRFQERPWDFSWSRPLLREAVSLIDSVKPTATGNEFHLILSFGWSVFGEQDKLGRHRCSEPSTAEISG
jgi:hypothetical protein